MWPGGMSSCGDGQPRPVRDDEHAAGRAAPEAGPDPRRRAGAGAAGGGVGADGRQHAAVAGHRGAQPGTQAGAGGHLRARVARPTPGSAGAGRRRRGMEGEELAASSAPRRRRLPRRPPRRGPGDAAVHRRSGQDGHHRQEPRPHLDGRRRLRVHRGAERHARLPGRGPGLHADHAALHPRARGQGGARHPRRLGDPGDRPDRLPGRQGPRPDHPAARPRTGLRRHLRGRLDRLTRPVIEPGRPRPRQPRLPRRRSSASVDRFCGHPSSLATGGTEGRR